MLPIHPQPFENELLSSWITRLSIENGFYSHTFFNQIFGFKEPIFNRDIDKLDSQNMLKLLSNISGSSIANLSKLSLASFEGQVFEKINTAGNSHWILPLGIYHRTKRKNGIVFCPACLKEDKVRYFRKYWRLAFQTICHKHHCILLENCPHCLYPIDYQRVGIGCHDYELPITDLGICMHCYKAIYDTQTQYLDKDLEFISTPYRTLINSFIMNRQVIPDLKQPLNLQVFNGLWLLCNRIMSKRAQTIRERILNHIGIDLRSLNDHKSFEFLSLPQRQKIMIVVLFYTQNWPNKFIDLVKDSKFTISAFSDHVEKIPFWLNTIIDTEMNKKRYITTDQEIISAIEYLKSNSIKVTEKSIAGFLGIRTTYLKKRIQFL